MASLQDVADLAGVSVSTVSRALRGTGRVSEATRNRIKQAAESVHFTLSRSASSLASGKTMRVSIVVIDRINTWFNASAIQGAYEVLEPAGYDVVPRVVSTSEDLDAFVRHLPGNRNLDGIIVVSINLDDEYVRILRDITVPSVGLDARSRAGYSATVRVDEQVAMRQAVGLLHSLGHRRIGFVEMPNNPDFLLSAKRRSGAFLRAARDLGYNEFDLSVFEGQDFGHFRSFDEAVSQTASRIIAQFRRPTALCVEIDDFAIALQYALRKAGIRVSEDIALIGFDDNSRAEMAGLTTLRQDPHRMGQLAAEQILQLMQGQVLAEPHQLLHTTLVTRQSTGAL